MRKYVVDYRFDNCGFLLDSIIYNYENVFKNLVEKYNYLDWLVNEAKYELENYGDSIMAERVEKVLKWINQVEPKLVKRIQHENPMLFKILQAENDNVKSNNKLTTETDQFITNSKELIDIPIIHPDDKGNLPRDQNEQLMVINEPLVTKHKTSPENKTIKLIKCNMPRNIFINAILNLAEEDEEWKFIKYKDQHDLESQITTHFSFPDYSLSKNTSGINHKIVWMKSLSLLHYFIVYLSNEKNKIFDLKHKQEVDMIITHFCNGLKQGKYYTSKEISDAKRYKTNKGNSERPKGVPLDYELINEFISFLKL